MSIINASGEERLTLYELIEKQGYLSLDSLEGSMDGHRPPKVVGSRWRLAPGLLLAVGITVISALLSRAPFPPFTMEGMKLEHPLGVSILAILLGLGLGALVMVSDGVRLGCKWVAYWLIPVAIVCLGAEMDAGLLGGVAWKLVAVVMLVMMVSMGAGMFFGRVFGLGKRSAYLLGVGTAVCGSSAVMAVAPVTGADDEEVVLAVGAVNLVGLVAMMVCVAALWVTPMGAHFFGAWAGATIHAVPQVVAAGQSHGIEAAAMATLVKLLRVSLLVPVVLGSALAFGKRGAGVDEVAKRSLWGVVPWFVWGFVGMAILRGLGWLPGLVFEGGGVMAVGDLLGGASKWLLAVAMAAIGVQVNFRMMLRNGGKALLAAVVTWVVVAGVAFGLLMCLGDF